MIDNPGINYVQDTVIDCKWNGGPGVYKTGRPHRYSQINLLSWLELQEIPNSNTTRTSVEVVFWAVRFW